MRLHLNRYTHILHCFLYLSLSRSVFTLKAFEMESMCDTYDVLSVNKSIRNLNADFVRSNGTEIDVKNRVKSESLYTDTNSIGIEDFFQ